MSKRARPLKRSVIILEQNTEVPLYRQLYRRVRAEILTGQLEAGARLPSTRVLASELGVSRNTVALVYEQLLLEGYIESRVGDGTRVARLQPDHLLQLTGKRGSWQTGRIEGTEQIVLSQRGQSLVDISESVESETDRSSMRLQMFRVGFPDVTLFPYETWARLLGKHARQSLQAVSLYQNSQGYAPLREAIAAHIGITRSVYCSPEQIILTAGSQGALDLVARVLLDPGDHAWIENPGYLGARGALVAAGVQLVPVPVDREGLNVEAGRQLYLDARLAMVTPSHQFPTGVTMSLSRRLELLEWGRERRAWIVEDDYDSEYRYSGRPLEALQGLDSAGRVIYIGTFSKVLFPSLRLGYLVAPFALLKGFLAARQHVDVYPPLLEQLALADFMIEGQFARYLRKMRNLYLERRNALIAALTQELGDVLDLVVPEAGIHMVGWLPAGISAQVIVASAGEQSLYIQAIRQFSMQPLARDGLLFGFASATSEELRLGVLLLARVIRSIISTQ